MRWPRCLGLFTLLLIQTTPSGAAATLSETKLIASDATSEDSFGTSVAISGDTLVVGAPRHDSGSGRSGAAYVFERAPSGDGDWLEVKKLTSESAPLGARFGQSVAISGDLIAVGAPSDGLPSFRSGAIHVFERDRGGDDNWGLAKKLTASDPSDGDQFGHSVSTNGDTVAVGAHEDESAGPGAGSAYVFERHFGGTDNWGQVKKLNASDAAEGDHFGRSIAISDDRIAVGADCEADLGSYSGSTYLFERDFGGSGNWGEVKKLNASDQTDYDRFGWSVASDGDRVLIGMYGDDDPFHKSGSAYIFEKDFGGTGNWGEVKKLQAADPGELEFFGWSVSLSGDRAAAGSYSGSVYLLERSQGGTDNWGQVEELTASDASEGQMFGRAVAISNLTTVVGAQGDAQMGYGAGAAYVYAPTTAYLPTLSPPGSALLVVLLLASGIAARRALARRPRYRTGPEAAVDSPAECMPDEPTQRQQ